jgi:secondary thiamine-phosphate synthase enzyme
LREKEANPVEFQIRSTAPQEMIDITRVIRDEVRAQGIKNGHVIVFVPHTTAGITINENADPDVVHDLLGALNNAYPVRGDYRHREGNSHAHIKASLMGSSVTVLIEHGDLMLGTWQGIYFCEFDGPRQRSLFVKILED